MEQLLIPEKIKVGYQERDDTYTKKLAYVIYYDSKGKLRKETSWQTWRDENIDVDDFENVPTEGFVLNRGVGGQRQSYGWNARNEYIRVYDPRGFEFEISVANLLFILQECSSIQGKGLEGEFVYSWDGKELVLLPTSCNEYKKSSEFTELQSKKVSMRDLVPGISYKTKDQKDIIYIGRYDWFEFKGSGYGASWSRNKDAKVKKMHVFWQDVTKSYRNYGDFDSNYEHFFPMKSGAKLAEVNSDTPVTNLVDLIDDFYKTTYATRPVGVFTKNKSVKAKKCKKNDWGYCNGKLEIDGVFFIKKGNEYMAYDVREDYNSNWKGGNYTYTHNHFYLSPKYKMGFSDEKGLYRKEVCSYEDSDEYYGDTLAFNKKSKRSYYGDYDNIKYTEEELQKIGFIQLNVEMENGAIIEADKF